MLTPEEFAARMREYAKLANSDEEAAHNRADELMCELLVALGYGEGVRIFDNMPKWSA